MRTASHSGLRRVPPQTWQGRWAITRDEPAAGDFGFRLVIPPQGFVGESFEGFGLRLLVAADFPAGFQDAAME